MRLAGESEAIVDAVVRRPSLLPKAQHWFDVYLEGASDVVTRCRESVAENPASELARMLTGTLTRMLGLASDQLGALHAHGEGELAIEIEVLERRMTLDGVSGRPSNT